MFCAMMVVIALYIGMYILLYDGSYSVVYRHVCFVV